MPTSTSWRTAGFALLPCLLPLLLWSAAVAQRDPKFALEAEFVPASAAPGEQVVLKLTATVAEGWHAYGAKESVNRPVSLPAKQLQLAGLEPVGGAQVPDGHASETPIGPSFPLPAEFAVQQTLRVPVAQPAGDVEISGALHYQICDENGCEPPKQALFKAKLTVVAAEPSALTTAPPLVLESGDKVTVKARFVPEQARTGELVQLTLEATVAAGYHAYGSSESTNIPVSFDASAASLGGLVADGAAVIPTGEPHAAFGMTTYPLAQTFVVTQALRVPAGAVPGEIAVSGELGYQVCDENSCDPPTTASFAATLTVAAGAAEPESELSSWLALILACIGGGLFALAMPCTYPMIPITFSFFTKQAEKRGGNVLALALTYGLGIVLMFTLVGATMSGIIIQVVNYWLTNAIIGVFFVVFACALFGWINLNPPQAVQRLSTQAGQVGGLLGVFFMGATLVITSFTCTAPIVGTLLATVAEHGWQRAAIGMAVFGLTMAIPFVFLALVPTKVKAMPRSGEWMDTLKISLGFLELAAALKFVSMVDFARGWQILPRELFLLLWTAIFGLWALFLFGILRKADSGPNTGVSPGRMATGMVVTMLAAYFLFGAMGNKLDSVLTGFIPGYSNSMVSRVDGKTKKAGHELIYDNPAQAVQVAQEQDKLLLYNFTGFN